MIDDLFFHHIHEQVVREGVNSELVGVIGGRACLSRKRLYGRVRLVRT